MGRESIFSDPGIINLIRQNFIAVTADDWYQRRRDDAEGRFFRAVADQGPRKGAGGSTRQGIYVFTADGKLLAYRNHNDANVMRGVFQQSLVAWNKLPAERRRPGAVKVGEPEKVDARFSRTAPPETLVVNVFTRILERDADGDYKPGTCSFPGGDKAARDHLWLLKDEWQNLIPKDAKVGQTFDMPQKLRDRIFRFHLIDNTRGEPPMWERNHIRSGKLTLTIEKADNTSVQLKLTGGGLLATSADAKNSDRGFEFQMLGFIVYNREKRQIDRFDAVALGDHWGAGPYTRRGVRPGRSPLGVAFSLARGESAGDSVPPQAARNLPGYLNADR